MNTRGIPGPVRPTNLQEKSVPFLKGRLRTCDTPSVAGVNGNRLPLVCSFTAIKIFTAKRRKIWNKPYTNSSDQNLAKERPKRPAISCYSVLT